MIIERYLRQLYLRTLGVAFLGGTALFLTFDVLDRIDNLLAADASLNVITTYFLLKIPLMLVTTAPIAVLIASLATGLLLSRSSELTALRAAGIPLWRCVRPLCVVGIGVSITALLLQEVVVPDATRRSREIYNIDVQRKDASGSYSQSDLWWRDKHTFYSAALFDSRERSLHHFSRFSLDERFRVTERTDALKATYVHPDLGWTLHQVETIRFTDDGNQVRQKFSSEPLPIRATPEDFFDLRTDPDTMSFRELRRFIRRLASQGISPTSYLPDLYEKLAFPWVSAILPLIIFPLVGRHARADASLSVIGAIALGFSYYLIHSLSLALGRAEFIPASFSAWTANLLLGGFAAILIAGSDTPQ